MCFLRFLGELSRRRSVPKKFLFTSREWGSYLGKRLQAKQPPPPPLSLSRWQTGLLGAGSDPGTAAAATQQPSFWPHLTLPWLLLSFYSSTRTQPPGHTKGKLILSHSLTLNWLYGTGLEELAIHFPLTRPLSRSVPSDWHLTLREIATRILEPLRPFNHYFGTRQATSA